MLSMKSLKREWRKEMKNLEEKLSLRSWIRKKGLTEAVSAKVNSILGKSVEKVKKKVWVTGSQKRGAKPTPTKGKK